MQSINKDKIHQTHHRNIEAYSWIIGKFLCSEASDTSFHGRGRKPRQIYVLQKTPLLFFFLHSSKRNIDSPDPGKISGYKCKQRRCNSNVNSIPINYMLKVTVYQCCDGKTVRLILVSSALGFPMGKRCLESPEPHAILAFPCFHHWTIQTLLRILTLSAVPVHQHGESFLVRDNIYPLELF